MGTQLRVSVLLLLAACSNDPRVPAIEGRIKALEEKATSLEKRLTSLESTVFDDELKEIRAGSAYLTPGADGYSLISSNFGILTVALANVQPYATGSKVTLRFGNLTSATIDGLKATLEWGSVDKQGAPNNKDDKSREVTFSEALGAGGWTSVNVVLDGVPPTQLGFVRVSDVGHRGVRLRR